MAKTAWKKRSPEGGGLWMPLEEAEELAGGLEALLPHLRSAGILARHSGLYSWPGGQVLRRGAGDITPSMWTDARVDPATRRVIFTVTPGPGLTYKVFAIGIEVEADAVVRLLPAAKPTRVPGTGAIFWNRLWDFARGYRDQVGGVQHLPVNRTVMADLVLDEARRLGGRPGLQRGGELSRNIIGPLYAGKEERPVRKRKKSKKHKR
jgi:hypothetical protein